MYPSKYVVDARRHQIGGEGNCHTAIRPSQVVWARSGAVEFNHINVTVQVAVAEFSAHDVFAILQRVESGTDELVWSAILRFENSQHPLEDRRDEISRWEQRAVSSVGITDLVSRRAEELVEAGFHALDAAHLASAEAANCDRFLTCDDRLMRRASRVQLNVEVQNPASFVEENLDG